MSNNQVLVKSSAILALSILPLGCAIDTQSPVCTYPDSETAAIPYPTDPYFYTPYGTALPAKPQRGALWGGEGSFFEHPDVHPSHPCSAAH